MSFWEYVLLFLSVLLGGGAGLLMRRNQPAVLRLLLSFGGSYILGIAALHLLPGIFAAGQPSAGIWLLLGFFIQMLLEQFSRGVEHGHVHTHSHASTNYGLQILLGLCLHAFIEGMPLSGYTEFQESAGHMHEGNHLLYSIVIHNPPASFALVVLLIQSHFSRGFIIGSLLLFSAMSPLGALLAERFIVSPTALNQVMAVVVGSFLHISTTILFEGDDNTQHLISWRKMVAILAGSGLALLTLG